MGAPSNITSDARPLKVVCDVMISIITNLMEGGKRDICSHDSKNV